jgi:hypothetical protein
LVDVKNLSDNKLMTTQRMSNAIRD